VYKRAQKERHFTSKVVYRVTENDIDKSTAPRPARSLRDYVLTISFSNARLLELMNTYGLLVSERKKDQNEAIEEMRDLIEVAVWRNYFLPDEDGDDEPIRSARLSIEFEDTEPERALVVTRALGTLLEETSNEDRREMAQVAARSVDQAVNQARELLAKHRGEAVLKQLALRTAAPQQAVILRSQIASLNATMDSLHLDMRRAEVKRNNLLLRAAAEQSKIGITFELVEPGHVSKPRISKPRELAIIGAIAFLILLPLCGIGVGAFDSKIYDRDDAGRLGWRVLAHVGRFPGNNQGALDDRLRREHNQGSS
jgi:hypothetical protein